jgi:hypothetical protein
MRLRHPVFHTITPDGNVSTCEQMYQRTREFIGRIVRFDSLSETITALTLAGDMRMPSSISARCGNNA